MTRLKTTIAIFGALICLGMPAWAPSAGAVDENPFSNAGGDGAGGNVETSPLPPPAPRATPAPAPTPTPTPAPAASTPLPRPDAKPDVLVRMSRDQCRRLLRRHDVAGAAYVPGVDVRGNKVKSADLAGTLTAADVLPEEIAFELALNPLSYAGNANLEDVFSNSSQNFGSIKYDLSSGALTFNGKRIDDSAEDEMVALCRQALNR